MISQADVRKKHSASDDTKAWPSLRCLPFVLLHEPEQGSGGSILRGKKEARGLEHVLGNGPLPSLIVEVRHVEAAEELFGELGTHCLDINVILKERVHLEIFRPPFILLPLELVALLELGVF